MRAPQFWGRPAGPLALALAPLGALYGSVARARLAHPAPRTALPVIAIGGLTLGGDGKTPTALALARMLLEQGERPAFLTRGYGRAGAGLAPLRPDPARHAARDVGDEALLLAALAPTYVGADRAAAARLAGAEGASVLLLDDGLHSRRLLPDLAILVVDAAYGAGNGLCPPAGPLRAPLSAQLACADAVILIGEGESPLWLRPAKTLLRGRLVADPAAAARLAGARVFAFAGIGRPQKFLRSLQEIGAQVVGERWFPDHHLYDERELAALARAAERRSARLVTTEKDARRFGAGREIETLPVRLEFERPEQVAALLPRRLSPRAFPRP
ncbi:tetraacyldisaccharide 4'-kinase [Methylocystis bryophila]|uniref:Tetraacyldisaccharide 4'-kinase n=1 Tax=Methylocystis bryophila TaxID=655015 RepID=A0A1W6N1A8_9HYPH|nr:tetraacyldisaccharide 4'-kinase [Methylocystis bryophila]